MTQTITKTRATQKTNALKSITCALAAAGLLTSASVMANPKISYSHAGVQYVAQDVDDNGCDQDGLRVYGSVDLNSDFFALGSYSDVSDGACGADTFSVGVGYHTLFGADSSLYGALSVENISPDHGDSDTGLIAAIGLRGFINRQLEAKVELAHHTAIDGNTVLSGGVAYWFAPNLAATADIGLGTEVSELGLGLRLNF